MKNQGTSSLKCAWRNEKSTNECYCFFYLRSDWNEEETKEAFEKATDIINEKFPKTSILIKNGKYLLIISKYEEYTAKVYKGPDFYMTCL